MSSSKRRSASNQTGSEAIDQQTVNSSEFLWENILQYLSLEDKLKLEGVPKQFQRTVFKSQNHLIISSFDKFPDTSDNSFLYIEDKTNRKITLKSLEVLLKKCPNITSIQVKENKNFNYNPVFRLIVKYCDNLREFDFGNNKANIGNITQFLRKFGPKIKFIYRFENPNNYNLFPNIERLKLEFFVLSFNCRLKFNKLTKLELYLKEGTEGVVKTFVDTFPTLKSLSIDFVTYNQTSITKTFSDISNLKHLTQFKCKVFYENNQLFCDSLKLIANDCQNLMSLDCALHTGHSDLIQLFSSIKSFPALKILGLRLYGKKYINFSFETLKEFSDITHLTLDIGFITFNVSTLNQIHNYLPNLQYLVIDNWFNLNREEVTQMADILRPLSRLRTIKLSLEFTQ